MVMQHMYSYTQTCMCVVQDLGLAHFTHTLKRFLNIRVNFI